MSGNWVGRTVVLFAFLLGGAAPALAGRGTQIDVPQTVAACSLGATTCDGIDISGNGRFSRAYIYREGIVSLDALLPATATAGDKISLGSGVWFAPGFSEDARYDVSAFLAYQPFGPDAWAFNFYEAGAEQFDEFGNPYSPALQIQLYAYDYAISGDPSSGWDGFEAAAGYGAGGRPANGSLIGFSWGPNTMGAITVTPGLLVGAGKGDSDFVADGFVIKEEAWDEEVDDGEGNITVIHHPRTYYDNTVSIEARYRDGINDAVPEPTTWAMLVAGFGLAGAALRRRRPTPALA